MSEIKNLCSASKTEIKKFLDSFAYVFFDLDGVLFLGGHPLPGADTCVKKLKNKSKKVVAVTNNTVFPMELLEKLLKPFDITREHIVTPLTAMIEYLKKIKFDKSLVIIGSNGAKNGFREAGYKVVEFQPEKVEETLGSVMADIRRICETQEDIGAVIIDMDSNFQLMQAQRAIVLLSTRPDLLFFSGMSDFAIPLTKNVELLGPKFIQDAVETITQKQSIKFAKPSEKLKETLNNNFGVTDPKKVLFVGDSVLSDMTFAAMCGYQKLLVLTGSTKRQQLDDWSFPENVKPDYYVDGVEQFCKVLENL